MHIYVLIYLFNYLLYNLFVDLFVNLFILCFYLFILFHLFIYINISIIRTVSAEADAIPRVSFKWIKQNSFKQIGIEKRYINPNPKQKAATGCYSIRFGVAAWNHDWPIIQRWPICSCMCLTRTTQIWLTELADQKKSWLEPKHWQWFVGKVMFHPCFARVPGWTSTSFTSVNRHQCINTMTMRAKGPLGSRWWANHPANDLSQPWPAGS